MTIDTPAITRRNRTSRRVQTAGVLLALALVHRLEVAQIVFVGTGVLLVDHGNGKLVAVERREMPLDLGLAHLGEARRPPARRIVLVDDHGAHALVEIVALR